jgi:uncharacterized alpha-E superfamily protein
MLSRVAQRIYWMSRYLERVENTARLVGVYGELLLDLPEDAGLDWSLPLEVLGQDEDFAATGSEGAELHFLLDSRDNPASLISVLGQARENARTTRDIVPLETWRAINEMHLWANDALPRLAKRPTAGLAGDIVSRCHTITGIMEGTLSHGPAYQFVCMGRSLERSDMTTRLIDVAAAIMMTGREELRLHNNGVWRAILRALSAYQMYRQYVRRRIEGPDVVAFLLLDRQFPRSVMHCVEVLDTAAAALPRGEVARREVSELRESLKKIEPDALDYEKVHRYVDELQLQFAGLHDAIFETWLNPMRIVQAQSQQQ